MLAGPCWSSWLRMQLRHAHTTIDEGVAQRIDARIGYVFGRSVSYGLSIMGLTTLSSGDLPYLAA